VLIELGVVEQRHRAVLEVADGLSVTEVARRYGVTARPCTAGSGATPGAASPASVTPPHGRGAAPTRRRPPSRRASSSSGASTRPGGRAPSPTA